MKKSGHCARRDCGSGIALVMETTMRTQAGIQSPGFMWKKYLIGTNFRGHLISRKKGQHISRVFILAIWVQNYFLTELIFAQMKKKTYFENFIIILHFLAHGHFV